MLCDTVLTAWWLECRDIGTGPSHFWLTIGVVCDRDSETT